MNTVRNIIPGLFPILFGCCLAAQLLAPFSPAHAEPSDAAYKTTDEVMAGFMSPFCPGRLLRDCPSSKASALKETILERAQKGENADQIMQTLRATYGDEMLAAPEARGFGLFAWIGPALFLGIGLFLLIGWLLRQRAEDPS